MAKINSEQEALETMVSLYVGYEMGIVPETMISEDGAMKGWKEHIRALITQSFIASTIGKEIKNPKNISMEALQKIVEKKILENFKYGFCEVFKNGDIKEYNIHADPEIELLEAMKANDLEAVQKAIKEGALDSIFKNHEEEIEEALSRCKTKILKVINSQIALNHSLIQAVIEGNLRKVNVALTKGASINFVNMEDADFIYRTALEYATDCLNIETINVKIIKALLNSNRQSKCLDNAFVNVVIRGNITLVKLFLAHGANINCAPYEGSALYYATDAENIEMVKFLLKNGADVHVRSEDGDMSALEIASLKLFSNDALFKLFEKYID